jgi:hypothetical protein
MRVVVPSNGLVMVSGIDEALSDIYRSSVHNTDMDRHDVTLLASAANIAVLENGSVIVGSALRTPC